MKTAGTKNKNISKVKVQLPGDRPGTAHLIELRADGVHVTFLPGKGNHKHLPPVRHYTLEQISRLRTSAPPGKNHGTPVEECEATKADMAFAIDALTRGVIDEVTIEAIREQLRRTERALGKV